MKVHVDQERCVGGGQCVLAAPEVFDQCEEDGIVVLLDESPAPALHDRVRGAVVRCPAVAIWLDES
jgi:ferredoxin